VVLSIESNKLGAVIERDGVDDFDPFDHAL